MRDPIKQAEDAVGAVRDALARAHANEPNYLHNTDRLLVECARYVDVLCATTREAKQLGGFSKALYSLPESVVKSPRPLLMTPFAVAEVLTLAAQSMAVLKAELAETINSRDEYITHLNEANQQIHDLFAQLDAVKAELARLTTWHPASEPPPPMRLVLAWDGEDIYFAYRSGSAWIGANPTHWRELPPGPGEVTL